MKKLAKYFCFIAICMFSVFFLAACDDDKIVKGMITDYGDLKTTVIKDETLDTSNFKVTYTLKNKDTKVVEAKDLTTNDVDTSTVGDKILTITYDEFSFDVTIHVISVDDLTIIGFEGKLASSYKANSGTQQNKEEEFKVLNKTHLSGDDNPLDLRISIKGVDDNANMFNLKAINTDITIQREDGEDNYVDLNEAQLDLYTDAITDTAIDFSEEAIGETFKISVKLADSVDYDQSYFMDTNHNPYIPGFEMKTKVVDGYNVYDTKGLSLFDNYNRDNGWTELKTKWFGENIPEVNAIILQDDVQITKDDVPSINFYTKSELYNGNTLKDKYNSEVIVNGVSDEGEKSRVGSLKDSGNVLTSVYLRKFEKDVDEGKEFNFYGNYYTIDSSKFPRIVYGMDSYDDGRLWFVNNSEGSQNYISVGKALFSVAGVSKDQNGKYDSLETSVVQSKATFEDIYFVGNGERSNDAAASGGIVLSKQRSVNFTADNTIERNYNIGWFPIYGYDFTGADMSNPTENPQGFLIAMEGNPTRNAHYNYINSKGYNNYNSLFYCWGSPNVVIENGDFVGAGGSAIIADHASPGLYEHDPEKNYWMFGSPATIDIINTNIESLINSNEHWFHTFGAENILNSMLHLFDTENALLKSGLASKTMVQKDSETNTDVVNMIIIYKHSSKDIPKKAAFSRGYCRMFDSREDYESYDKTGKLVNESNYYGYDRTIDWTKTTMKDLGIDKTGQLPGFYTEGTGGYENMMYNIQHQANPEQIRYKSDSTGASINNIDLSKLSALQNAEASEEAKQEAMQALNQWAQVHQGNAISLYMSNGFGAIFKLYDINK